MPTYEYACDACRILYQTRHRMNEAGPSQCQQCQGGLRKVISAPRLNTANHSSPTAAKYARISETEEMSREQELQKIYQTIWVPPEVKHSPWDHDH